MLDYYYGPEAEQFAFYRIPKILFEAENVNISTDAKLLYGIFLDRMQLSAKNKWLDDNGRVYIFFTVKQIMKAMQISNKTAAKLLHELENTGFIEREKQGLTKPDRIYVKNFLSVVYKGNLQTCKNYISGGEESTSQEMENLHTSNTDSIKTDMSDTESIVSIREDGYDAMEEYRVYENLIRSNIDYELLCYDHPYERESLEEVLSIIVDTVTSHNKTVRISGDDKPVAIVRSRFLKLTKEHIEYVLQGLKDNPVKVRNMKAYLLASLYNAPTTISNYYTALVNHNMANGLYVKEEECQKEQRR